MAASSFTAPPSSLASSSGYNAVEGSEAVGNVFVDFEHGDSLRAVWPHQPRFPTSSILPPPRSPRVVKFSRLPDYPGMVFDSMKNFGSSEFLEVSEATAGDEKTGAEMEAANKKINTTASAAPMHGRLDPGRFAAAGIPDFQERCNGISTSASAAPMHGRQDPVQNFADTIGVVSGTVTAPNGISAVVVARRWNRSPHTRW